MHFKAIAPKYTSLAASFPHVQFLRVDVDKQQAIAAKYKITAMPTFIAIVDGEVKEIVRHVFIVNGAVLRLSILQLQGADPQSLTYLIVRHAGSPLPRLPAVAESAKNAGNVSFVRMSR